MYAAAFDFNLVGPNFPSIPAVTDRSTAPTGSLISSFAYFAATNLDTVPSTP